MTFAKPDRGIRSLRYVLLGTLGGVAYAVLNSSMDYLHARGVVARFFVALHDVVDDVVPVIVGALLGVAIHYWRLRARIAREERARAEELRARVRHVERDQAVWVVAAATLHELKNPLHAIGLLLDELEATPASDAPAVENLRGRLRAQMNRALIPLDGLRGLARGRTRSGSTAPVIETAERVVRELSSVTREAGVELSFDGSAPQSIVAEPSFVRIILENLIGNSIETLRGRAGGHIRVSLAEVDEQLALTVSDDGPGIPAASERTLFDALDTSKEGGLGLGLAIARALARAMNGDLVRADVSGWATTFRLVLPAAAR